jgi:8-amino-7-oxononanoate synthase
VELLKSYQSRLAELDAAGQLRACRLVEPSLASPVQGQIGLLQAVNFSSNDYLGLSRDSRLQTAAIEAIQRYGTGSSASRLVSGTNELVHQLELELAQFKQTEAALVFNSGYQANVAILQALLEPGDWVFCDKLNHASLVDGCLLSGARWSRYRHLDLEHLEQKLQKAPSDARKWIVTDSVFSMDGDYPDLQALVALADRYHALVMVDEAHATGLFGLRGSGLCEQFGVSDRVAIQMGTFSKALGGAGAYAAGSGILIQTLINRARGFIYSTALPPATVAAARCGVQVVQSDTTLKHRLWENIRLFEQRLQGEGLDFLIEKPLKSPIVPLVLGDSEKALKVSQLLLEKGYFVQGIRPPTVPPGTSRLRIALSAAHSRSQIEGLAAALASIDLISQDHPNDI